MADNMTTKLAPDPADSPESKTQFWVALAIVGGLVVLGIAVLVASSASEKYAAALGAGTILGTIIGALATALNAPSGIGKVLNAAKQAPQKPIDPQS